MPVPVPVPLLLLQLLHLLQGFSDGWLWPSCLIEEEEEEGGEGRHVAPRLLAKRRGDTERAFGAKSPL